jgi:hypothetical protein
MSEEKTEKPPLIQLDPIQLKDLIITIDYVTKELKNVVNKLERLESKLTAIEGELKLLRINEKSK